MQGDDLATKKCVPCEGGVPPLGKEDVGALISQLSGNWKVVPLFTEDPSRAGKRLRRLLKFKDFKETMLFVNKVAELAEQEGHHPDMRVGYGKLEIELTTNAIAGLSENDFILARKIDLLIA